MRVTVTINGHDTTTYGYASEHYAGVNLYYAQALADGDIEDYIIERNI
jgi:type II secretory pathway component PulC